MLLSATVVLVTTNSSHVHQRLISSAGGREVAAVIHGAGVSADAGGGTAQPIGVKTVVNNNAVYVITVEGCPQ